ncbi:MAG: tetratricopeptide repeat protein [Saprospiraceae bacterium]
MKNSRTITTVLLAVLLLAIGCVTTKKKNEEAGWLKRNWHNLTSKYNYWFNADELLDLTVAGLEKQHTDNYGQMLTLYPYTTPNPQSALADLDNVIKKSSMAISLHRVSDFTDDCYTMIGQAQFLKRDFETAEATFQYIREEHNPNTKAKIKISKEKKEDAKKKKKKPVKKKKKKPAPKKKNSKPGDKTEGKPEEAKPAAPAPEPYVQRYDPYNKTLQRTAAYPLAMVWYGRTLIEREKYDEADFLFRDLDQDAYFPEDVRQELHSAQAYLWIRQKQYDKAISPLEKAVKFAGNKNARARLAYILSQLYEQSGQFDRAYDALETVLKSNPVYVMEFNARLRRIAAGWTNGKISNEEANKSLESMIRDEKNNEYRDQIYFTMASIALKAGKREDAITYLQKSIAASSGNNNLRGEAYLLLADMYFEGEDFVFAKKYFDSTLTVLPATDERFSRVRRYADNLTEIARHITTIATNDSIVRIFYMSTEERKELAQKIKKQREEDAQKNLSASTPDKKGPLQSAPTPKAGQPGTSFYFYNDAFLKKGRKDFAKTWDDRKLEDNWRRSTRQQTGGPADFAGTDSLQTEAATSADLADIFQGVPQSEEELAVLHASTYEALYHLGVLFRDKLENNKRCSNTLEDLLKRYPEIDKFEKEAWYYCYMAFTALGNTERAKYYFDKLVGKYPTSPFARVLTDPDYVASNKERERELNQFYEQTYSFFTQGNFQTAFDRCTQAPQKYGTTNPLIAKFALLSALCTGNLQGKAAYCQSLKEVIARHPESAEATRAKEIARLLSCEGFEVVDPKTAAGSSTPTTLDEAFTPDDDKLHYFLVAITGDVRLDDVKIAVSDYNREFHKLEQLRISNIFLGTDTNTPILVIRKFDNKAQAMRYFEEVRNTKEYLGETTKKTYAKEFFAITQENYRRVLKNKTLDGYREFFSENYMK